MFSAIDRRSANCKQSSLPSFSAEYNPTENKNKAAQRSARQVGKEGQDKVILSMT